MFIFNIPIFGAETSSSMYNWYGSIYGASGTPFNINNNVQKRTASYLNSFSYLVPAGRYLNSINFIGATDSTFSKGNTYEINVDIVCGFEPLAEFDFYEGYLTETYFNNLTALQLRDEFSETFSLIKAPDVQSSLTLLETTDMPQYNYTLTILHRPSFNYDTLGLALCMLNQSDEQSTLIMSISSVKGVSDIDGDYYQKRSAELQEEGNAILNNIDNGINDVNNNLEDISGGINDVNNNLEDISGGLDNVSNEIENAPQNEYDFAEQKNSEIDVDSVAGSIDDTLPAEIIDTAVSTIGAFISENGIATTFTVPSAKLPSFAGGLVLWEQQTVDFSQWLNNKDIKEIITVVKVITSFSAIVSTGIYIYSLFNVNNTEIIEEDDEE